MPASPSPVPSAPERIVVIAAVNNEEVLARNLAASPCVASGEVRLLCLRGARSTSLAYLEGMAQGDEPLIVFAHQDVYLPAGWTERLRAVVAAISRDDPAWAAVGPVGVSAADGSVAGRAWSTGLGREVRGAAALPCEAVSLDEVVIVLRRASGVAFDPALPDFHLYGTDIVTEARARGMKSYVAELPLVHNSRPVISLGGGYAAAYRHMQRKWRSRLPLRTTVGPVTRFGLPWMWRRFRIWRRWRSVADRPGHPAADPREIARRLGYEA